MQIFKKIPGEIKTGCQRYLNDLLKTQYEHQVEKNFVDIFNHDTDLIQQYLSYTDSEQATFTKFDKAQDKYNETIIKAKKRWEKNNQSFYVAKNTMHEMSIHKKEFEKCKESIEKLEENKNQFELFLTTKFSWEDIRNVFKLKNNLPYYEQIKIKWEAQSIFARYSYEDMLKAYDHIIIYEKQLNFWISLLSDQVYTDESKQFLALCQYNFEKTSELKQAMADTISLRINHALNLNNLSIDSPTGWIESALGMSMDLNLAPLSQLAISDLPKVMSILKSKSPNLYRDFLQALSQKTQTEEWLIPYICDQDNFIPIEISEQVPKSNMYFSNENQIVLQMNTLKVCVDELLENLKNQKFGPIQELVNHSGFKGILELGKVIADEMLRAEKSKPNKFSLNLSYYSSLGSAYQTEIFLNKWQAMLEKIKNEYDKKAAIIAKVITQTIEDSIFRDLKYNLFEFPASALNVFKDYIEQYGDEQDKKTMFNLFTPTYVISKFDLIKEHVNTSKIEIDDDKVQALFQFAKLYWPHSQVKAIEVLINLLEGEGFPNSVEEDAGFVKKIMPIFVGENAKKELLGFIKNFSENYLSKITEPANDSVYRFLLRFHPVLADLWTKEREDQIEKKYTEIGELFSNMSLKNIDLNKVVSNISLLNTHDKKKNTLYILSLSVFIESYISQYKGESNILGEALYALYKYNPENLAFLEKAIEKRIQYLIKKYKPLDDQDMAWFFQMRKDPDITDMILNILEKNYKGFADNMINMLLVNPDSKLFSVIFSKYVLHNFLRLEQNQIDSLMDTVSLLSKNETNQAIIDGSLIKAIDILQGSDYFKSTEQIHFWLRKYGTTKMVEHYFLKKIEVVLQSNNWDALKITVAEISEWLGLKVQHKPVFTLAENQQALFKLYHDNFESYHQEKWDSQYQYLTEWLSAPETKIMTQLSRVKWFESFVNEKIKFNKALDNFKLIDLNIHQGNQSIPKVDMSLSEFYGTQNMDKIISLIQHKMSNFDPEISVEVYEIINRYLSEREIKSIPEGYLAYQQFEIYQKFYKLWKAIVELNFDDAILFYRKIMVDSKAINRLSQPNGFSPLKNNLCDRGRFFQDKLAQVKSSMNILYKQNLYNKFYLNIPQDQKLQDIYIQIFGEQEIASLISLSEDSKGVYAHFNELKDNLSQGKWNLVKFDLNIISKFKVVVPTEKMNIIIQELIGPTKTLGSHDRLMSILAYTRLIKNEYIDDIDRTNDVETVKLFNHEQENISIYTKKVTAAMISKFKHCHNMSEMGKFFSKDNTFRSILLTHIDSEHFGQLQHFLVLQLKGLFDGNCPKEYLSVREKWEANILDLTHWQALSQMMGFVKAKYKTKKIPNEDGFLNLAKNSIDIAVKCFEELRSIFVLSCTQPECLQDIQNLKKEITLKQNSCIRAAIFIRFFGSDAQQNTLETWIDSIAAEQRKIMMKGILNETIEKTLNFVEKLIRFSGNEEQKIENDRLNTEWYIYHCLEGCLPQANTDEVVGLRKATLEEAFHDYVPEFDKQLFRYFIDKFKCDEKGIFDYVKSCKIKFGSEYMIEVEQFIKTGDLKSIIAKLKTLQVVVPQEEKQVLLFKYKSAVEPVKRDAIKFLFALGLSAKLHAVTHLFTKQLKENPKTAVNQFRPILIRQPLTDMLNKVKGKYDLGKHQFMEGVEKSIDLERKYFIDWNQADFSPRGETGSQIRSNIKNVA